MKPAAASPPCSGSLPGRRGRTRARDGSKAIGCMPSSLQTGREYLELAASDRKTAVDNHTLDLADRFGLTPHLEKRFEQMSFGTRKKIFLTSASVGAPPLVLADGP